MKTVFVLFLVITTSLFPQQNDDIRIYPSQNHQSEISIAIDSTSPNNTLTAAIGKSLQSSSEKDSF